MSSGYSQMSYDDASSPRVPKRTPVACTFCRGRKLKCDGLRPLCSNCNRRNLVCQYMPVNMHPMSPSK